MIVVPAVGFTLLLAFAGENPVAIQDGTAVIVTLAEPSVPQHPAEDFALA